MPYISKLQHVKYRRRVIVLTGLYWLGWLAITHRRIFEIRSFTGLQLDKIAHFVGYCVLAFLLSIIAARRFRSGMTCRSALWICLFVAAGGIFDEITQPYFGRSLEWSDYAADLLGGLFGLSIAAVSLMPPRTVPR